MTVIYEDGCLTACLKPPGIESEKEFKKQVCDSAGLAELYAVHRLDRETGGIIIYAKTPESAAKLSALFSSRNTEKRYYAAAEGELPDRSGIMDDLLFHDRNRNKSYVVTRERKGVKKASLEYSAAETVSYGSGKLSLYSVLLHTGRTHQIRVQFASRGCPLTGDRKYGSRITSGFGLWAYSIKFRHPETGEMLELSADLPADSFPWKRFETIKKGRSE